MTRKSQTPPESLLGQERGDVLEMAFSEPTLPHRASNEWLGEADAEALGRIAPGILGASSTSPAPGRPDLTARQMESGLRLGDNDAWVCGEAFQFPVQYLSLIT